MIPNAFEYHAPKSVDEAVQLLAEYADEAKLLAGGHSLLPMMKLRFAEPAHLVDINGIPELRGIRIDGDGVRIGAMTTENAIIDLGSAARALSLAAGGGAQYLRSPGAQPRHHRRRHRPRRPRQRPPGPDAGLQCRFG